MEMFRKFLRHKTETKFFENSILAIVILNTVVLSMSGYLTNSDQVYLLESINKYVVFIFIGEMSFKLAGYGVYGQ